MLGGSLFASEPNTESRTVEVHKSDIIPIYTQFGFNTAIILPRGEEVKEVLAPERTFWGYDAGTNWLLVKAKGDKTLGHPGQKTSITVAAASGNFYTFLIQETSTASQRFDLRVELEQADGPSLQAIAHPEYVRANQLEDLRKQLDLQARELVRTKAEASVREVRSLVHDYTWKNDKNADLFGVRSMYRDEKCFYIEAQPKEAPALYELKDGKPALIQFTLENGRYTVPHIVDDGVLRIGKHSLEFHREKGNS